MLIVEGADLVGKTTFANRLLEQTWVQRCGHVYSHLGKLPSGFSASQYLSIASTWLVQDRFHLSELACRMVDVEPVRLCPETYRLVDAGLRMLGAFTVVITATSELIAQRFAARGDAMYNLQQIQSQNDAFLSLATRSAKSPWSEYAPDVDLHIHVDDDTDALRFVYQVVTAYRRRLHALSKFNAEEVDVEF